MTLVTNLYSVGETESATLAGVSPTHQISVASFDRPDNTTAYTARDVISDDASTAKALEFPSCGTIKGGGGRILSAFAVSGDATEPTAMELLVFSSEPTNHADNAALTLVEADLAKIVGKIRFDFANFTFVPITGRLYTPGFLSNSSGVAGPSPSLPYVCDDSTSGQERSLFGLLVMSGTYGTPVGETNFTIGLGVERN